MKKMETHSNNSVVIFNIYCIHVYVDKNTDLHFVLLGFKDVAGTFMQNAFKNECMDTKSHAVLTRFVLGT